MHLLTLKIGLRYTRAKQRNHFISFTALVSMLGIGLGVTVLITVLSVMNGFDHEIQHRIFSVARQLTITGGDNRPLSNWEDLQQTVLKNSEIIAGAPFVAGQGMLTHDGLATGVMITGILPLAEEKISEFGNSLIAGAWQDLVPGEFGVVLGVGVAGVLGAEVGDQVTVITPQVRISPLGMTPRFKQLKVVGIFRVGDGFGYDTTTALMQLEDAQRLFALGKGVTGINLKLRELYRAPLVAATLERQLVGDYRIANWTEQYGSFFKAIQMEKTTMFVVLLFIIAVAAFNLVSSLVMNVTDKRSDIAILRTLGATPRMIMEIFIVQGGMIGLLGTLLGVGGGILLAWNAPDLVVLLERIFHTNFISAGVYFVDYLPSKLMAYDIWRVAGISFGMSLLATIYPAWRAAQVEPATALRYE